jgi:hypothetical protein
MGELIHLVCQAAQEIPVVLDDDERAVVFE